MQARVAEIPDVSGQDFAALPDLELDGCSDCRRDMPRGVAAMIKEYDAWAQFWEDRDKEEVSTCVWCRAENGKKAWLVEVERNARFNSPPSRQIKELTRTGGKSRYFSATAAELEVRDLCGHPPGCATGPPSVKIPC
jgi:hypothetical protein